MRIIINIIAHQVGWFAAVLGAGNGMPWLGVAVIPLVVALHLALSLDWKPEMALALGAAMIGFSFDTVLVTAGVFSPVFFLFPAPLSPPWMVMLWINFATTLNVSLGRLRGKYVLAAILGAVGGPVAYYGGAELGAMTVIPNTNQLIVLGIAWACAVPLLYRVAALTSRKFKH